MAVDIIFWTVSAVTLLLSVLLFLLASLVLHLQYSIWKYRHLPSPQLLPHWSSYFVGHGNQLQKLRLGESTIREHALKWISEIGPIFVLHVPLRTLIFMASKDATKEFLASGKHFKNRDSYDRLGLILSERFVGYGLITESDESVWEPKRKLFNPAFHRNHLKLSMDQFNKSTDDFIRWVTPKADGKTVVKMLEDLTRLTLDVIGKVGFGFDCKAMTEEESKFRTNFTVVLHSQTYYERNPWEKYSVFPAAIAGRKKVKSAIRWIRKSGEDVISNRMEEMTKGECAENDILSYILKAAEKGVKMSMEELVDEFVSFFLAGNETAANTLSAVLLHLSQNPDMMARLQEEVDQVLGKRTYVEFQDLPKLEYMTAVIKETLRVSNPVTAVARQASYDVVVNGHLIPKDSIVIVTTLTHALPGYFPDPLSFKPERFLNGNPIEPHTFIPFSVGNRTCIGQQFAMIEMKVILSKLLQAFHFRWVPGQSYDFIDETTTKPKDGALHYLTVKNLDE